LRKLDTENLDAIVLAAAGLVRLGLADRVTDWLPTEVSLPAAGQGIVAVQIRAGDERVLRLLEPLNSTISAACALAERTALVCLGGGCHTPIGLLATIEGLDCIVEGVVVAASGEPYYRARVIGLATDAREVGKSLADALLEQGAGIVL
jgi:hydroxymethylbilane synthase